MATKESERGGSLTQTGDGGRRLITNDGATEGRMHMPCKLHLPMLILCLPITSNLTPPSPR
jgi:hypothetical protein